jgi:hypothetical protein
MQPTTPVASEEEAMTRPPHRLRLLLSTIVLAWLGVAALAAPAAAHEGENATARTLVETAVAVIRTQPEQMDVATDKIKDALEADDKEGVDLARVQQAQAALEAGDMPRTELLLEQALGACPGEPVTSPVGVRAKLPQTPCPTPTHELALGGVRKQGTTLPVLLTVGAVLALGGLVLSRRIR